MEQQHISLSQYLYLHMYNIFPHIIGWDSILWSILELLYFHPFMLPTVLRSLTQLYGETERLYFLLKLIHALNSYDPFAQTVPFVIAPSVVSQLCVANTVENTEEIQKTSNEIEVKIQESDDYEVATYNCKFCKNSYHSSDSLKIHATKRHRDDMKYNSNVVSTYCTKILKLTEGNLKKYCHRNFASSRRK